MKKVAIAFLLIAIGACAPSTPLTGSWKKPNQNPKRFKTVMVTGMTQNLEARQTVENNLATALHERGIKALKSIETMPPEFTDEHTIDKEELLHKIRKTGADGIFTITLIHKETENRYIPGRYGYTPVTRYGYYGRFSGYYSALYPTLYSPGYYENTEVYFIETNFYDAATEDLLWSAQSQPYNPYDLNVFSQELVKNILAKMSEDGVLR